MSVQQSITEDLQRAFTPRELSVINESHMHNVPPGAESHFKVVLVSDSFEGQRKVARHQQVSEVLQPYLNSGVHALALHTYSVPEWLERNGAEPASPSCLGGSKAG